MNGVFGIKVISAALLISVSLSVNAESWSKQAAAQHNTSQFETLDLFTHERSLVDSEGRLLLPSQPHPAYRQLKGLLPPGWDLAFTEQRFAVAPLGWSKNESWTGALDRWAKPLNANVMVDGFTRKIIVSPEQPRRRPGVLMIHSENELHREMYEPQRRYREAASAIYRRLHDLVGAYDEDIALHEAQSQLFGGEQTQEELRAPGVPKKERGAPAGVTRQAQTEEDPAEFVVPEEEFVNEYVMSGDLQLFGDGRVAYPMQRGPLRPQITAMLVDAGRVATSDEVIWEVSDNHQWANDFLARAETFDHLVGRILQTYRMRIVYQANDIAVIRYTER